MSLPDILRVRLTSESVESIALSPVVAQDMTLHDLVGTMLGVTGKDARRIREILARGSLVAAGSRYRWEGFAAEVNQLEAWLTRFPDNTPDRPFNAAACFRILLRGEPRPLTVEREHGEKRRLFRRRCFWDEVMDLVIAPQYVEYSYREQGDVYRQQLNSAAHSKLQESAALLAYSTYEAHIRRTAVRSIDLVVRR